MDRDVGCDGAGSSSCRGGQGFEGRHLGGRELVLSGIRFGGRVEASRRKLGVGSSGSRHGEVECDRPEGCALRGAGVVTRPESNPGQDQQEKRKRKDGKNPNGNSRLGGVFPVINHDDQQQQQDSGMDQRLEKRCRQRTRWGKQMGEFELATAGMGLFFAFPPSPPAPGQRPSEERLPNRHHSPSPHVCPHPLISTPHPTPHIECRRDFWHPLFALFAISKPRENVTTSVFYVNGNFMVEGNHEYMFFFRCRCGFILFFKINLRGLGGMMVEVPLPTTTAGFPSQPLPPGGVPLL